MARTKRIKSITTKSFTHTGNEHMELWCERRTDSVGARSHEYDYALTLDITTGEYSYTFHAIHNPDNTRTTSTRPMSAEHAEEVIGIWSHEFQK